MHVLPVQAWVFSGYAPTVIKRETAVGCSKLHVVVNVNSCLSHLSVWPCDGLIPCPDPWEPRQEEAGEEWVHLAPSSITRLILEASKAPLVISLFFSPLYPITSKPL